MGAINMPLQVIVHCEAGGDLRPLRFRYEDEKHVIHTVQIEQISDSRNSNFVGIDAIHYICKGKENENEKEKEHMYELKYTINTHKWVLFRQIY